MWDTSRTLAQDFEILLVSNRKNEIQWISRGNVTWWFQKDEKEKRLKDAKKEQIADILKHEINWQSLWKVKKDNNISYMHPTQKPVEINVRVLENFTKIWDSVLDLFWGSGSNLLACEKVNRKCYMMELDPKYVEVIIKRFNTVLKWTKNIECVNRDLDLSSILDG